MLDAIRKIFGKKASVSVGHAPQQGESAPGEIVVDGLEPFRIKDHITMHNSFPIVDWDAVASWLETAPSEDVCAEAWSACEHGWLLHFRDALGEGSALVENASAVLIGDLDPDVAQTTLAYMSDTLNQIAQLLGGMARIPEWGKDILIVFDDADSYYNYISHYYPEEGVFSYSGGIHISDGCSHLATHKAQLWAVEQVVAHEMTHGCLAHLPLPVWLNEGIAVNTERYLAGGSAPFTPREMRKKHLAFWGREEVQEFWSGNAFSRPDDGSLLSYDMATIFVEQMSKDWGRFKQFVVNADWQDGGSAAAREYLGIDLGQLVCNFLEQPQCDGWAPDLYASPTG